MTRKRICSTLLPLIVTVIVTIALCGISVFADDTEETGIGTESSETIETGVTDPGPEILARGFAGSEGTNGENIYWTLDSTGLLNISGRGRMKEFVNSPWINDSRIREVIVSKNITNIGTYSFYHCTSLEKITISDTVTRIGERAFEGCSSLTTVNFPGSITQIGICSFSGCSSLTSVDLSYGTTEISISAFQNCSSLKTVHISDSVTRIESFAFEGCSSLTTINIPDGITIIGTNTFKDCSSLTTIKIPDSVTEIGDKAFFDCSSLASITIPESVNKICNGAFLRCGKLSDIVLKVSPGAFEAAMQDTFAVSIESKIYISPENLETYEHMFTGFEEVSFYDLDGNALMKTGIRLQGYKILLDGSIGVEFIMEFTDDFVYYYSGTSFMKFTVNGKDQKVMVNDASRDKDGNYVFRCDVVAKEMADTITAQMYREEYEPVGQVHKYSVREYADHILKNSGDYSKQTVDLVKAMLNYGAASQNYFNYRTKDLANSILEPEEQMGVSTFVTIPYIKEGDISPARVSLTLNSTLTMKLYFKTEDVKNYTFKYRKNTLPMTTSGEYTIVTIDGIYATLFSSGLSIKYTDENAVEKTLRYAPCNYAYIVLNQSDAAITPQLKNVVRALYKFSIAAADYANSQTIPV